MDDDGKARLQEQFERVGKALASGRRLELLELIAQGPRTVEALAQEAGLGLTSASAHLQALKRAGLVTARRDGVRVYHELAGEDVLALLDAVRRVAAAHLPDLEPAWLAMAGLDREGAAALRAPGAGTEPLLARVRAGEAIVVDVRPRLEYEAGHIPGAVSLPAEELVARIGELPADAEVVAYCRGAYCVLAYEAVAELRRRGRRACVLEDGMVEWRAAGGPVATGAGA